MPALSPAKPNVQERYRLFAKAYQGKAYRNATQAAILAGYSPKTASSAGYDLLRTPEVRRLLRLEAERQARKVEATPERVIDELASIAFSNVADFTDDTGQFVGVDTLARSQSAAISELIIDTERRTDGRSGAKRKRKREDTTTITRQRLKLHNKIAALELLGRTWNQFGDRDGGQGTAVKVIVVNSPRPVPGAIAEAQAADALPDGEPIDVPTIHSDVRTEWDGYGGADILPDTPVSRSMAALRRVVEGDDEPAE